MPKINPIRVYASGPGDLSYHDNFETHVLADGTFQTLIGHIDMELLESVMGSLHDRLTGKVRISKNRKDVPTLTAKTVDDIAMVLNDYGHAKVRTEREEALFIFYKITLSTDYVTNRAGEIFPNGGYCPDDYQWHGPKGGFHDDQHAYAVGVVACVVKRVIHTLPNGRFHTEIERPTTDDLPEESFGAKLNQFTHTCWPNRDFWSKTQKGQPASSDRGWNTALKYMPYDEGHARFFYDMMMKLCHLSEGIRQFFGDKPADLQASIADPARARLLIGGPAKS